MLLLSCLVLWAVVLTALQSRRFTAGVHYEYEDDALYMQILDGVGSAEVPRNTIHPGHRPSHFTPLFFALWPLFALLGGGWFAVFVLKSVLIGSACFAGYLLGYRKGLSPAACFALGAIWLCWPPTVVLTLSSFRPITLAMAPLCFLLVAYETRRFREMLILIGVVVLCREDLGITAGLLSVVALVERRPKKWIMAPALITGAYFVICTQLILPQFMSVGYRDLIVGGNLDLTVWGRDWQPSHFWGLAALLLPLAFLPLGSWLVLCGAVGVAAVVLNLSPFKPNLVHLLSPAVAACYVAAGSVITRHPRPLLRVVWVAILIAHIQPWIPPSLGWPARVDDGQGPNTELAWSPFHPSLYRVSGLDHDRAEAAQSIPDGASVTTVGHLLPLFATRRHVYEFGHRYVPFLQAQYAVLEPGCVTAGDGAHKGLTADQLKRQLGTLEHLSWVVVRTYGRVVVLKRVRPSPMGAEDQVRPHVIDCDGHGP